MNRRDLFETLLNKNVMEPHQFLSFRFVANVQSIQQNDFVLLSNSNREVIQKYFMLAKIFPTYPSGLQYPFF